MFELHFLGRGAAFFPAFKNTNAFFEIGKDIFFLDFGETAFETVAKNLPLAEYEHIYVFLTHMHADHSGSLSSFVSYLACVLHKKPMIIHPENTVLQLLTTQGIDSDYYQYAPSLSEVDGITFKFIPVQHAVDMRSYGILLTYQGETIYYSGDSAKLPESVLSGFLNGSISHIYHDTASHPSEFHCYYKNLAEAIPLEQRHRVSCMHLDCDMEAMLRELGFDVVSCAF